jgi:hypothetical protein
MLPFVAGNIYFNGELLNGKSTQEIVAKGITVFLPMLCSSPTLGEKPLF